MDAVADAEDMFSMRGLSREARLVKGYSISYFSAAIWGERLYTPGSDGIGSIRNHVDKKHSGLVAGNLMAMHLNASHHVRLCWDFAKSGVGLIEFCEKAALNDDCEGYFSWLVRLAGGFKARISDMEGMAVKADLMQMIKFASGKPFVVPISKRKRYAEDDSRADYMHDWLDGSMESPSSELYETSFFQPLAKRMRKEAKATVCMLRAAHKVKFHARSSGSSASSKSEKKKKTQKKIKKKP